MGKEEVQKLTGLVNVNKREGCPLKNNMPIWDTGRGGPGSVGQEKKKKEKTESDYTGKSKSGSWYAGL